MANHTDEHGRSTPARSTVAKRMRGALKGHKHSAHKAETKAVTKEYMRNPRGYNVHIIRPKQESKVAKDAISGKPHHFKTRRDASTFADSMHKTAVSDWKNQGRRTPKYKVEIAK